LVCGFYLSRCHSPWSLLAPQRWYANGTATRNCASQPWR